MKGWRKPAAAEEPNAHYGLLAVAARIQQQQQQQVLPTGDEWVPIPCHSGERSRTACSRLPNYQQALMKVRSAPY